MRMSANSLSESVVRTEAIPVHSLYLKTVFASISGRNEHRKGEKAGVGNDSEIFDSGLQTSYSAQDTKRNRSMMSRATLEGHQPQTNIDAYGGRRGANFERTPNNILHKRAHGMQSFVQSIH